MLCSSVDGATRQRRTCCTALRVRARKLVTSSRHYLQGMDGSGRLTILNSIYIREGKGTKIYNNIELSIQNGKKLKL